MKLFWINIPSVKIKKAFLHYLIINISYQNYLIKIIGIILKLINAKNLICTFLFYNSNVDSWKKTRLDCNLILTFIFFWPHILNGNAEIANKRNSY